MAIRYVVGWNALGASPEHEPRGFQTYSEAKQFLRDEIRWLAHDEVDGELSGQMYSAAAEIETSGGGSTYHFVFGSFEYWMRPFETDRGRVHG